MSALLLAGCHQNLTMSDQKKLDEWERSSVFRNGKVLQSPAPGSVSREQNLGNVLAEKPPLTLALVQRGRERFNIFCSECHGPTGDADGTVVQRGFPKPPSFHEARLVNAPDEHFVDVITNGHGVMYSYADRVPPADRWAIAAYIRALQRMEPVR
jgi:mono/diheme cytochrome c family protein